MQANRKAGIAAGTVSPPTFNLVGTATKPGVPMLTDTQCRAARPHEKPYRLPDGSGLLLEVEPNGVKAWRYRFKLNVQGVTSWATSMPRP